MINCPYCGKLSDPKLDNCPHCGGQLQRTQPMAQPPTPAGRNRQTCPTCQAVVQEGDIICVACGTNLLTGQRVAEQSEPQKATPKWPFSMPYTLTAGGVVLLVVIIAGFWLYLSTRDPVNQAQSLVEDQNYLEAIDILQPYVERVADDERALIQLGLVQVQVSRYAEAADSFEQAVRVNPSNADAALWAVVSLSAANTADALARQVELLERVVEARPGDVDIWYLLALARGMQKDVTGQIEALERVIESRPTSESARLTLGVAHALQGELGEAQETLQVATREDNAERGADVQAAKGFVAAMQANDQAALGALRASAQQDGLSIRWHAFAELGKIAVEQGRFGEAEDYLKEALSLRPRDPRTQYLHGLALQAQGLQQEALIEFNEVVQRQGALAQEAAVQVAQIHLETDNILRAKESLDNAATMGEGNAAYYTVRGRIAADEGDLASAQQAYRRAINADPAYAPAYLENGLLYVKREQLAEGVRELEEYLELAEASGGSPGVEQIRELVVQLRRTTGDSEPAGS